MSDEHVISEGQLGRIQDDLAIMQRAMGLRLSFDNGMLAFGILLAVAAVSAGLISLISENEWLQVVPFAVFMALGLIGAYLQSQRNIALSHEVKLQVSLSITVYFAVICASSGYVLVAYCGPSIGAARTAALYAASLAYILAFIFVLVLNALRNRERYYCFGLAIPLLLTGLLIPLFDPHYSFTLTHGIMAIGYLASFAIQRFQLQEAVAQHAAD